MSDIKSMKLYTHAERIDNELAELVIAAGGEPGVEQLSAVDHNFQSCKWGGLRLCAKRVE